MIEEREIAGVSVPFAVGTAACMLLYPHLALCWARFLCCLLLLATVVLTASLACFHPSGSRTLILLSAGGLCLLTGAFCALSHSLAYGIPDINVNPVQSFAGKTVGELRKEIGSIPFRHTDTGAILNALITGDRSLLTKETTGIFRESGASHILALSGLHLGLIYLMLRKVTYPLGNTVRAKRARYLITVGASLFYCMMTGAGPSISRATIFIFLGETARLLGRQADTKRILLASLTIQLAIDPGIVMNLGFQLSYLAMTGLLLVFPSLKQLYPEPDGRLWKKIDPFKKIWDAAMMSISCQMFTGPLVWLKFQTFPQYFLITNMVALPMTNVIMVLSVTTITLHSLGICPQFLIQLDEQSVQALIYCLKVIASPDGS